MATMNAPYSFQQLLRSVHGTELGRRFAALSLQTKIERFLLAELMFNGAAIPGVRFQLEEKRRDLTVRQARDRAHGPLLEWLEAKMAYSDCLARRITGKNRAEEYCELLASDAAKQRATAPYLPDADRDALMTTAVFVVHRASPAWDHKYYQNFGNRASVTQEMVLSEAERYATEDIPAASGRKLVEHFSFQLDEDTKLFSYFYRD
jgi:hypothetical protein